MARNPLGLEYVDSWETEIAGKKVEFLVTLGDHEGKKAYVCICKIGSTSMGPEFADHKPTREEVQEVFCENDIFLDEIASGSEM